MIFSHYNCNLVYIYIYMYILHKGAADCPTRVEFPNKNPLNPSAAHYSWPKICGAVGIGSNQLIRVR